MSYDSAALQDVVQALDDAAIVGRVRPRFPVLGGWQPPGQPWAGRRCSLFHHRPLPL